MRRIWVYGPDWWWHGWQTLLPILVGGDEHGRRVLEIGWTVTGKVAVAVSRPGRLYRPDGWTHHDDLTGTTVRADIYPYGAGNRGHGVQLSVLRDGEVVVAVIRVPQLAVRELAELIAASRRLVWHDPCNADDEFWNPQEGR